jgi:putative CocE/NonD family hydrolase
MSDGAKLAATIWLPKDAQENPVPAILEYIPYRKNDFTAIRDSARHPYFEGHGYASIRVDIRGSGDSDGILLDEYLKQEQDDELEVFDWIVKQSWSTGSIGIFGKSWGGFNGLQVAARQHPDLKAIIIR